MGAGREGYEAEAWFHLGSSLICVPGLTRIRAHGPTPWSRGAAMTVLGPRPLSLEATQARPWHSQQA